MGLSISHSKMSGFTLVEILMVIILIGILSTVGITQFINFNRDAKSAVTTEKLNALKTAITGDPRFVSGGQLTNAGFEGHCLAPPASLPDLITLPASGTCAVAYDPFAKRGWRGPYVSASDPNWNKDAWGSAIEYFVVGPPARTIRSCGPDLICGNSDDLSVSF